MEFRLSVHAKQEMVRRQLPPKDVESVLQNPEQTVDESRGRKAYQSRVEIGGKMFLVRAIVVDTVDPAIVVTVYRTTKISKYWRTI